MKKLNLKKLNLGADDLLQREQLKSVFGGYGGYGDLNPPSGGGGGSLYKCCWNGTNNCSKCVSCTSSCTCVSGAELKKC